MADSTIGLGEVESVIKEQCSGPISHHAGTSKTLDPNLLVILRSIILILWSMSIPSSSSSPCNAHSATLKATILFASVEGEELNERMSSKGFSSCWTLEGLA